MNFRPIILNEISGNFAIIVPFNGKDKLCIYSEKKEALRMFSMYNLGEYNKNYFPSLFNSIFSSDLLSERVNVIESEKLYYDIDLSKDRTSKIKFMWTGECTVQQREKLERQFSKYSDEIYISIKNSMHSTDFITKINNKNLLINSNIEDHISLLSYQADRFNMINKRKRKSKEKILYLFFALYIILLSSIFSLKLFE